MTTTSAAIASIVNAEWISPMIMDYARDFVVGLPYSKQFDLRGKASPKVSVPKWTAPGVPNGLERNVAETVSLSPRALAMTSVELEPAEMGILRPVTKKAIEDGSMSLAEIYDYMTRDAGRLMAIAMEDDFVTQFASASASVGVEGTALNFNTLVLAIAQLRKNKVRAFGGLKFVLDEAQAGHFDLAGISSTATTIADYFTRANGVDNGYVGSFAGIDCWQTGLCKDVDTTGVIGGLVIDGSQEVNKEYAPIGLAIARLPEADFDKDIGARSFSVAITARHAIGTLYPSAMVGIVSTRT